MIKKIAKVVLLGLLSLNAHAQEYSSLKTIDYNSFPVKTGSVSGYQINYLFSSTEDSQVLPDIVYSSVEKMSSEVFSFASLHNLQAQECINNPDIYIYQVSMDMLNGPLFADKTQHLRAGGNIWGLFDPTSESPGDSFIFLTDHGDFYNKVLLAHELSHYWYHRMCWAKDWPKTDEEFALAFQAFYIKKNL